MNLEKKVLTYTFISTPSGGLPRSNSIILLVKMYSNLVPCIYSLVTLLLADYDVDGWDL